jgi:hypothetical protein
MAYKYSKGAFIASGSVSLEDNLTVTGSSTLAGVTATTISGTTVQFTTVSASALGGAAVSGISVNYVPTFNSLAGTFVDSLIKSDPVSRNISLTASGGTVTLQVSGSVTTSQLLTVGNALTVSAGGVTVAAGGLSVNSGDSSVQKLTVNGDLIVLGNTFSASVQNLIIEDKQIVLADGAVNAAAAAGAGFFVSGANVQLTYKQNGEGTAASSGDIFQFSGSVGYTSVQAKTFYGDLIGSTINAVTSLGDVNQNPLATGINFANANFTVTRTWTLPTSPATGSAVRVKGPSNLSPTVQLVIAAPAGYDIDGESTAALESPYAAVECVFVGGPSGLQWKIF